MEKAEAEDHALPCGATVDLAEGLVCHRPIYAYYVQQFLFQALRRLHSHLQYITCQTVNTHTPGQGWMSQMLSHITIALINLMIYQSYAKTQGTNNCNRSASAFAWTGGE